MTSRNTTQDVIKFFTAIQECSGSQLSLADGFDQLPESFDCPLLLNKELASGFCKVGMLGEHFPASPPRV
jgi:hypothetical protein